MLGTIWLTLNSFSGTVAKADQMIWQFKKQSFNFSSSLPILRFFSFYFQFFLGSPSQEVLDFGTMGMGEKRDIYFAILNKNPIAVTLRGWGANLTGSLVEVIGVDQGNETEILERASFEGMTRKLIIPTGHYLIFRLGIHTTEVEGAFDGYVYVETSYHTFKVCTYMCFQ